MENQEKYVFSQKMLFRCSTVGGSLQPIELMTFEQILTRLDALFIGKLIRDNERVKSNLPNSLKQRKISRNNHRNEKLVCSRTLRNVIQRDAKTERSNADFNNKIAGNVFSIKDLEKLKEAQLFSSKSMDCMYDENCITTIDELLNCSIDELLNCLIDNPCDYVHISTFKTVECVERFLTRLLQSATATLVEIDIGPSNKSISVLCQVLADFSSNHMILKGKKNNFLMFMRPF